MDLFRKIAIRFLALQILATALPGCCVTNLPLWGPIGPRPHDACETSRLRDVAYYDGKDCDKSRHRLDLYLPTGKKDYPVVVFVHGGAWMLGDNRCCGLYPAVGEFLASQGIGAVLPNYRLAPGAKHPENVKDIARAVAWTKANIAKHGGDPDQLFLLGHSAGGHLVALLATDERYLKNEGMKIADLKGVIGVSGVYQIPPGNADVELGGSTPLGVRLDEMAPLRGASAARDPNAAEKAGLPVSVNVFGPVFGPDAKARADASPVNHVRPGLPPFLILSAERDLPLLPAMARDMHRQLLKHGNASTLLTIDQRNHNSIIFKAAERDDPTARAIVDFVRNAKHVRATAE